MRRPQPASGLVAMMASLLVAALTSSSVAAVVAPTEAAPDPVYSAASTCTPWRSEYRPPNKIRVLRTRATDPSKEVLGTVQVVDFGEYVATVMAAEWPERYPLETLKAGAIATKQYAWYYILHPRGGTKWKDGQESCYDVVDSTVDQWFRPEVFGPGTDLFPGPDSKIRRAMDATWVQSLRKYNPRTASSRFFLTGYRDGSSTAACGDDRTGYKLFHNSTRKCGQAGLTYQEILRLYLNPYLEIVTPGLTDIIGSLHGDASAMEHGTGVRIPHVWTPGRKPPEPGSRMGLSMPSDDLIGYASGDMDGDGRADLVWLSRTGATSGRVTVALSDGVGYAHAQEWWSGDTIVPVNGARLLIGDFQADGRNDLAILGRGPTTGSSSMVVLKRKPYGAASDLKAPVVWWSATEDPDRIAGAWLGDLSGDGRADLIVRLNPAAGGIKIKTAVTRSPLPSSGPFMGTYKARFSAPTLAPAKVRLTVADANRDGRADVLLLIGGSRARIVRLQGQKLGGFKLSLLWRAPKSAPVAVRHTRLAATDMDFDGRADIVLYEAVDTGTRIRVLKTDYTWLRAGPKWRASIAWADIHPY